MIMPMYTRERIYILYCTSDSDSYPCDLTDFTETEWPQAEQVSGAVDNSLIEEGFGDIGRLITLNCSYDSHRCLYRGAWADSQRPATSLYLVRLVFPERSPAQAQTAFQHHGACLRCWSGLQLPPPPSPITSGERKRERCLSWTHIKGNRKRDREELWRGLELLLWDHFKDGPAKIAAVESI